MGSLTSNLAHRVARPRLTQARVTTTMNRRRRATAEYKRALALAQRADLGDQEKARGLREAAARKGDDRAVYALRSWYLHGVHVKRDMKKAKALLQKAATLGNGDAVYELAVGLERGAFGAKRPREAFSRYLDAAARRIVSAYMEVARCLYWARVWHEIVQHRWGGIGSQRDAGMPKLRTP